MDPLLTLVVLAILAACTPAIFAEPCYDKAVKCPQFRAACSAGYANHLKQQCPNTCSVCKYKGGKASDQEAITRIQKCCQANGMSPDCLPYCRFNTTRIEATGSARNACTPRDGTIWMVCANDGQDSSECCRQKGVADNCLFYCKGYFHENQAPTCIITYQDQIQGCLRAAVRAQQEQ